MDTLSREEKILVARARSRRAATGGVDNESIQYLDVERLKGTARFYDAKSRSGIRDKDIEENPWTFAVGMIPDHDQESFTFLRAGWDDEARVDMLTKVAERMAQATTIVSFNGGNADIKWLEGEFAKFRIDAPARGDYRNLDLYILVRRHVAFGGRLTLRMVASELLDFQKGDLGDIDEVGRRALDGDENAWKLVEEYNRTDVELLIALRQLAIERGWTPY